MENELVFNSFLEFYKFLKDEKMIEHTEIIKFVSIMDSVDKSCGCVRGSLHERANGIYQRMMPIIEIDCQIDFQQIKTLKEVGSIRFLNGDEFLLKV